MSFREDGHAAVDWAADYLERVGDLPVLAQVRPGEIRARLPQSPPEQGEPFEAVLNDLDEILMPGVTHWQHPRFFAYFAASASEPGILAELLAATLNSVGFLWRTAPASTELELLVCDWVAQLLGLPPGWHGHIEDTASTSTLAALIAARHITGRNVVVCSEHAHSAADKAARMLGMELRKAPSDGEFRMLPELPLDDVAAVVATVGTTSTSSVDPVPELARRCAEAGAWLHVDAAYAGSAMVCPELRWAFEGVERADSLVVNAHKWLFTPMDCSLLWTSRPAEFREAFSLVPEFLRTTDEGAFNLSEYGPALGRRFRSLKLWAVLRCYGREGLQARIRETIRLAELFESWVGEEPGWELCAPRHFSLVCFRREGSDEENEAILERVNSSGEIFISHTKLNGATCSGWRSGTSARPRTTSAGRGTCFVLLPVEVQTERLLLRQWCEDDLEPLYEIYVQPEYLETMPAHDRDWTAEQIERFSAGWRQDGYSQWAACELQSGRLIDRIGILCHHDWPLVDAPVPEVGWVLHRDFWGLGLATEGGRASIEAWREHLLDEPRLYSFTSPENARSRAVMERLGLTYRGDAHWHGWDMVWYALDR